MFHSNTQQMIDYWRSKSGVSGLPVRADIDPTEFAKLAPQVFMLGREASGNYPVRLAGGLVSELHQRDLRGRNFLTLLDPLGRREVQTALEAGRRRPEPVVAAKVTTAPAASSAIAVPRVAIALRSSGVQRSRKLVPFISRQ